MKRIKAFFSDLFKKKLKPNNDAETKLYKIAKSQLGVSEHRGNKDNKKIKEYLKTVALGWAHDEMAWCSAFVKWCYIEAGISFPHDDVTGMARSHKHVGIKVINPKKGDIVIMWRKRKNSIYGHVAIFDSFSADGLYVRVIGGNQGDCVCYKFYDVDRVLEYRRII